MPTRSLLHFVCLLGIVLYCIGAGRVAAQTNKPADVLLTKKMISTDDGLASREVLCGTQDNDGFIWFGTRNGLNRYDGKSFLLFTRQHNHMQDNKVVQLATDNANHLFIAYGAAINARAMNGKVDVMDIATHQVKSMDEVFHEIPFKGNEIIWFSGDGAGNIIWLTRYPYRIWQYNPEKGFRLRLEMGNNIPVIDTSNGLSDYTGRNSVFQQGCMALALSSSHWYFLNKDTVLPYNIAGNLVALGIDPEKNILFLDKTLRKNTAYQVTLQEYNGLVNRQVSPAAHDLDSVVNKPWREIVGTIGENSAVFSDPAQGMYLWKNNSLSRILGKDEVKGFIVTYCAFTGKKGDLWICTSEGVIQLTTKQNNFRQYFTKNEFTAQRYNSVRGIYADDGGNIFAGVAGALCVSNSGGSSNMYPLDGLAYALYPHDDHLLVSTSRLYLYDRRQKIIHALPYNKPALTSSANAEIWSLFPMKGNKILIGAGNNIFICYLESGKSDSVKYASGNIPTAKVIYRFFKTKDGYTWAVASTGLYRINDDGLVTDYYGMHTDAAHQLPFNDINDMYEDGNGIAWLATNGEGLFRWEKQLNRFSQFSITEGLSSNVLYRIEADAQHNLWISSDNGLMRFNPVTFSVNRYTIDDGISDNEFNRISSFTAKDGRMFFGGLNGISAFYPGDFAKDTNSFNAPLRITAFSQLSGADNKLTGSADAVTASKTITLQPGDKFFTLEFQLLDYIPTEAHRYAYRIDGIDKEWNYINENSIRISGLAYGNYLLHIKGENAGGAWSHNQLAIALIVLKPFYLQVWFIIVSAILVILCIYFLYRWRTTSLIKEKAFLEQTVHTRTGELREMVSEKEVLLKEIHHRVKNNLQVISALLEMQSSRSDDARIKAAIMESQNRVLSIAFIHQNLYQQQDIKTVEICSFVNELAHHLHQVFAKPGCDVQVENNIPQTLLDIDTAVPLGLIINELITNSYKYAFVDKDGGNIVINMQQKEPGIFLFEYSDNGIGLPAGFNIQESRSLGLRLVRQLCKQLGGKLEYIYREGSYFYFTLKDLDTRNKTT